MNARILQIVGGMILLACMGFALLKLESADEWVSAWIPAVVVGVAVALAGAILGRKRQRMSNGGRT